MKKLLVGCLTLSAVIILGTQVYATMLSFNPSASSINVGDSLDVDVVISGLASSDVGTFDLEVIFDDSILTVDTYSLSDNLGDISAGDAEDWSLGDTGPGKFNLSEISWLFDFSFQGDSFTLATLSFTGNNVGHSGLRFVDTSIIGDGLGYPIEVFFEAGSVDVNSPVPEPATMLLFGTGIAGIVGSRIRRKKNT